MKLLFSWNVVKAALVTGQSNSSFTHCLAVLTSKFIHHVLFFAFLYPALTLISSTLSVYVNSAHHFSLFLRKEILRIAGQSSHPAQKGVRSALARTECSAPVGVFQLLENKGCCSPPQRLCYTLYMANWMLSGLFEQQLL